ncbi:MULTISPECIES: glycosyltransferase family 9 protein [unclassified Sulfurospirillum]|uniref:glycosyltransferase family 9 protein n=1 Tax=unclassified Sulfurospirillum TaxID=2618290 RepID=UPI0005058E7C|nr:MULTISPECIES: glycosyltransferase family 9 protein [unclassified Sulfurospirillum]KFL34015.1 hypothetical protein JU57_07825 [Sulfurospirillum sp. SCADC]
MNLAVIKFSALGDIAESLPVLRAFKQTPTIITSPLGKALLQDEFDDFMILSNKKALTLAKLIWKIRKQKFDWLIDLQNNDRSRLIDYLSNATHIANHDNIVLTQNINTILYEIAQKTSLVNPLDTTFVPKKRSYIVLNCGSSPKWASKRLPAHKWHEISALLYERFHLPFILTGDLSEKEYVEEILKSIVGEKKSVAGNTTLQDLKKILSEAFLTVSTDSGPMHLSAVQKTPTIGLFGPTNWIRTAPYGPWSTVVYDTQFYANPIPPMKSLMEHNNYFDHICIDQALVTLSAYLV